MNRKKQKGYQDSSFHSNSNASDYNDGGQMYAKNNAYAGNSNKQEIMNAGNSSATPVPPNDKMIHVSQCKNEMCPLKDVIKGGNHSQSDIDQQFIPFYACPKCHGEPVKYCSQRCFQQDWFKIHQFECSGQMPEARDSVLLSDVQRIEASTPFIKESNDGTVLTAEQQKLEVMLSNITKADLEFIQTKEAALGKGSYGEVQLAKHKSTGIQIAVKKIEKASLSSSKIKETLVREIRIQKQLNHEYICRLYTSFEDKTTIYLALEYASKGNLFYLIRKEKFLSEDTAFYFFIQVCSGIYYLHKQGLIHRDIKPENILIKDGNIIKICDFGWCVQSDHMQQRNTFCGTLEYMAPEMIQNKNHNHTLDIWSLGILLYELVHGRAPFTGVHPREISDKIMRGQIRFKPGLSKEYKDLVNKILIYECDERLPLIKVFDHPWVKNFEKKYNLSKQPSPKKEKQPKIDKKMKQQQNQDNQKASKSQERILEILETSTTSAKNDSKMSKNNNDHMQSKKQQQHNYEIDPPSQLAATPGARQSRKTGGGGDIIKELEDYVKDKKTTANKFLDDISEYDQGANQHKQKENNNKKYKDQLANEKETHTQNTSGLIKNEENQSNIDVYDYCDKMMKDLSQYDKQINKNQKKEIQEKSLRYSNKQNKAANDILNGYADGIMGENETNGLNKSQASGKKDTSYMSQKEFQQQTKKQQIIKLQQQQQEMQMRQSNHSYRSNKSNGNNKSKHMKYDKNYDGGFQALDENDKDMNEGSDDYGEENSDDSRQGAIDLKKKKSQNNKRNSESSNDFENHNNQIEHKKQQPQKNESSQESYDSEDGKDEMSESDDWYEEEKGKNNKNQKGHQKEKAASEDERSNSDDQMDDLVNAHNQYEEDLDDLQTEEERRRLQRSKRQMKIKGMDQPYQNEYENRKKQASKRHNQEEEESQEEQSSEEEENQTFMQKLGGFLFFGCGGTNKR